MDKTESRLHEIENVFERLGLASAHDRGSFLVAQPKAPTPNFNVVISATSTPAFG